jgi:hypothetical protein
MAFLADLERLLERVFERSSARLFRTHVQAVQLERRVERAMEHARHAEDGRTAVPSRYRVRLAPPDLAAAADQEGSAEALAGRLADAALAFARAHGYHLRGLYGLARRRSGDRPRRIAVDAVLEAGAAAAHPAAAGEPPTEAAQAVPPPAQRVAGDPDAASAPRAPGRPTSPAALSPPPRRRSAPR